MNTARGEVPTGFALDACVDGTSIWIRNQLESPVHIAVEGAAGAFQKTPADLGVAAVGTRAKFSDQGHVLPSDTVRIPIGASKATVSVGYSEATLTYLVLKTIAAFVPKNPPLEVIEAGAELARGTADALGRYADCKVNKIWIGQQACWALYIAEVSALHGVSIVRLGLSNHPDPKFKLLGKLIDAGMWLIFVVSQPDTALKLLGSTRTLQQAPRAATTLKISIGLDDLTGGYPVNVNPVHRTRPMTIRIYDSAGKMSYQGQQSMTHVAGASTYAGTLTLPGDWKSGTYQLRVRLDYTLFKTVNGVKITAGQAATVQRTPVVVADVNQDNAITAADNDLIMNCFSDGSPPKGPCDSSQKRAADVDDDGAVGVYDYNLWLRQYQKQ